MGCLIRDNDASYMVSCIDQLIPNSVTKMEDRMAKVTFKLAVEMSMIMNLLAANLEIKDDTMSALRRKCIDELKKSSGSLSFKKTMNKMNG
ncbi:MAG: hypothetical protein J6K75_07105 [Erysipelotrichaceae bacterium]|nr:hypothetical protein [Erysipelotrichaceae bacterium]